MPIYQTSQYQTPAPNMSTVYGPKNTAYSYTPPKPVTATRTTGSVLGANTGNPPAAVVDPYANANNQQEVGNSFIDRDYELRLGELGSQESGLRGQAGIAEAQIANDVAKGQTTLGSNLANQQDATNQYQQTGEKAYTSSMQQARDLFRQTQQSNIAQLSALGISSSSVSEALAERLGVETARRIASNTNDVTVIRLNATKELGRIQKYHDEKVYQLEEDARIQKSSIQQSLMQGLNQINSARDRAAADKARARQDLLSQTQNYIAQISQQEQQFRQSLEAWTAQKSTALQSLSQDDFFTNMNSTRANLEKSFNPTQFDYTQVQNIDKYGNSTGQIRVAPKKQVEDEEDDDYSFIK